MKVFFYNNISLSKTYPKTSNISKINCVSNPNNSSFKKLSFKGYYGDPQPVNKLFYNLTGRSSVYQDTWTNQHLIQAGTKKWVDAHPSELLKRTAEQAIQSICTLTKKSNKSHEIPSYIPTPNYGNNWGRRANYIEINPRVLAKYENGKISEGLLQTLKLLPAIPTSPNSFANCVLLSQLYSTHGGDGSLKSETLYHTNLHTGISNNLTSPGLYGKMGADEQVKAFNDLAHLLGFKTGFRMVLPNGQLRLQGKEFNWNLHEQAYLDACIWGVELGFDCIHFDSAKHIIDMNGYCGIGNLPTKDQMSRILYSIRKQTGRNDLSFIGEKCDDRSIFKEMGFTAGTDWGKADNFNSVKWESQKQKYSHEYAAGPEVSNDNDTNFFNYSARLNRINSCLYGFDNISEKLPSYMQLNDLFPISQFSRTHNLMIWPQQMNGSNAWTECERHWDGAFDNSPEANIYRAQVYNIFKNIINQYG